MSPLKLGLSVLWPACWTGLPIKLALALLMLAMDAMQLESSVGLALVLLLASPVTAVAFPILALGLDVHLGEGAGLAILFLLAVPVDIWALGLAGRTVFLERLRVEPPDRLGATLWWQLAIVSVIYLPLMWLIERTVTHVAQSVTHSILELELMKGIPVAERISIELTLWGSVATVALIALLLIGLWLVGWVVRRHVHAARPAAEDYQGLISRWDLMRVPADQPLMLTVFTATGVTLVLLFWAFLPATTPHPHESYKQDEKKAAPVLKPTEALQKAERVLTQAESSVQALEEKAKKSKGKAAAPGKKGAPKPKKA